MRMPSAPTVIRRGIPYRGFFDRISALLRACLVSASGRVLPGGLSALAWGIEFSTG